MKSNLTSLLIFILLCTGVTYSQNSIITDSLICLTRNEKDDTLKVIHLYSIAYSLDENNIDSALAYANRSLILSTSLNYKNGISNSLNALGNAYASSGEYDTAIDYYYRRLKIASELNDSLQIAAVYDNIGIMQLYKGDIERGLEFRLKSHKIYLKQNNTAHLAGSYNWLGNIYKGKGEYPTALNNFLLSLSLYIELKNVEGQGFANSNISAIYYDLQQYDEAIKYGREAIALTKVTGNKHSIGMTSYRLAIIFIDLKLLDSAQIYLHNAELSFSELRDRHMLSSIYNSLGTNYQAKNHLDSALIYFYKSLNYATEIGNMASISAAYKYIGAAHRELNNIDTSLSYLTKSYNISKSLTDNLQLRRLSRELVITHSLKNNSDSLMKYLDLYEFYSDTIFNAENANAIANMRVKYESEKKEKENITLKLENENQAFQNLLLFGQGEIARLNFQSEKDQRIIAEKLTQIQEDNIDRLLDQKVVQDEMISKEKELRSAEKLLSLKQIQSKNQSIWFLFGIAFLIGTSTFLFIRARKRNMDQHLKDLQEKALRAQLKPHFLFNALSAIQKNVRENPTIAESYLSKFSQFTQEVLENSEKKRITLAEEIEMLSNYVELQGMRLTHRILFEIKIDPAVDPDDVMVPPAILQPLVENSIIHNFLLKDGQGKITFAAQLEKGLLKCTLEDYCDGTLKELLFNPGEERTRKSFGTKIVKERIELYARGKANKGYFQLNPQSGGMRVLLGIPT